MSRTKNSLLLLLPSRCARIRFSLFPKGCAGSRSRWFRPKGALAKTELMVTSMGSVSAKELNSESLRVRWWPSAADAGIVLSSKSCTADSTDNFRFRPVSILAISKHADTITVQSDLSLDKQSFVNTAQLKYDVINF